MTLFRRSLMRCRRGVAVLEFALIFPILVMILIGTTEIARYTIMQQKLDHAAHSMADLITQSQSINTSSLDTFSDALDQIIEPFEFSGTLIFTSVAAYNQSTPPCLSDNVPCVTWQYARFGGNISEIGSVGGPASLPDGYNVLPGQNIITAEIFFDYTPMLDITPTFIPSLAPQQIYKVAAYKPRFLSLATLNPN